MTSLSEDAHIWERSLSDVRPRYLNFWRYSLSDATLLGDLVIGGTTVTKDFSIKLGSSIGPIDPRKEFQSEILDRQNRDTVLSSVFFFYLQDT